MLRTLPSDPRRILIVRLGSLGDVARVLPMLVGLRARFPDAEIDWVVQKKAVDLLRGHPQVDRLFTVPFRRWRDTLSGEAWRLSRSMRKREYDLILDFQGSMKGTLAALLGSARGSVRVGWSPAHAEEGTFFLFHGHRTPPGKRVNRHLRFRCLVDWLAVPDLPGEPPAYDRSDTEPVDRFVAENSALPRPWTLVWPWTSPAGAHRRWDLDRMRDATRGIAARTGGTAIVGWGPAEEADARAFVEAVEGAALAPRTTIRGLCRLLEACDLYVGVNTGPMHLAALVGTPVVAVFGSRSDPAIHAPLGWKGPVEVIATEDARELKTRERRGIEPFEWPDPEVVVDAALGLLGYSFDSRNAASTE